MDHDCIEETDYGEGVDLVKTEKLFMSGHRVLNMKKPKHKVRSNVDFCTHNRSSLQFDCVKTRSKSMRPRIKPLVRTFSTVLQSAPSNQNLIIRM